MVETVAIREDALFDSFSPHSDQFTVTERIRFISPGVLEDRLTAKDPKALLEPFTAVRTYTKASAPNDELREFFVRGGIGVYEVGSQSCRRNGRQNRPSGPTRRGADAGPVLMPDYRRS